MRVLLAISVIYHITIAQQVGINVPCNKELDGLLTADPDGDERAFMSCQGVGVGTIGFWERKLCPNNMVFDFINQHCKEQKKKARKQQNLSIAILNNSCANGETCIGGSVCDLDTLRCMCPYGTTPKLDTLSCESSQPPFVSATVDGPAQFFNSFSGGNGNRNNQNNGFMPFGQPSELPDFQPNNNFKYGNNFGQNQNSNNNNNDFNWNPNFNWNNNQNNNNNNAPNKQAPMNNAGVGATTTPDFNPFQPNPNQQFVFNFNKNQGGQNNQNNHVNNNNHNQNIPVLESKPKVATLVGIGALCSDLAECDHGSTCVMGRCTCVSPLVQHEGKCVLRQQQKIVGPGELCDSGETCGKGSICDSVIPVCVCPAQTDLSNGECISVPAPTSQPVQVMTPPPTLPPVQVPIQTLPPQTRPPQLPPVQITQPPIQTPVQPIFFQTTRPPMPTYATTPATTQFIPKQIYTTPPQMPKNSIKINQMKIGGSKQAGVGVRCSLNTDCMIGAYCNGNTNPPSCQCLSTHVNIEGRCEKVIYPGQVGCRSDLQCHAAHSGTHCIDRICVCPEGQRAVDQTCVSASEPVTSPPGGSCSNLRECTGGSVCREGWCICPDPSMIVNRGICIQSGPKPTLPPRTPIPQVPLPPQLPISVHVPQVTITKAQPFITEAPLAPQGKKIVPGGRCGPIDVCVGGSNCIEGFCLCPAGQQPSNSGRCEKFTTTSRQTTLPSTTTTQGTTTTTTAPPPTTSVFSFTIADLLSTRRQPAFIEIPTHVPLTTTAIQTDDECTAIGLICKGNTVCRNKSCQCPETYVLHHDGCVSPEEAARRKARGKARHEATTARLYSKPGESCTQGQTCVGGSACSFRKLCECPQDKSEISQGQCVTPRKLEVVPGASCNANTVCTKGSTCESGLCRCQPGYIAVSGNCVALPMSTTPKMRVIAKPLESCENGETCEGGSNCDYDTGICMCPPGQIVFNVQCMPPPTQPQITTRVTTPVKAAPVVTPKPIHSTDCEIDANCGENKICVSGKCKCKPGFVDNSGTCEPLEGIRGRSLRYGQACDRYQDKCINGAKCIDKICKCAPGFLLAPNGWCEGFDLAKAIEINKQSIGTTPPVKANRVIQTKMQQVYTTSSTISSTTTSPAPTQKPRIVPKDFPTPPSNIFGFPDRRTTKIVPKVAAVGSACRPIDICLGESVCTNGFCHCPENYIRQNGQCISKECKHKVAKVGETCKNGEICAGGSICDYDRKRCICAAQHVAIRGICKQKSAPAFAAPGDTCSMREKCTGGATCFEGMCTCDDHHFAEDGYCRPIEARSSKVQFVNGAGLRFSSMQVPNRQRAQACNEAECKLPNCFCTENGRRAPGGLRPDETPQFVVLTFDDAVNGKTFSDYKKLFENDVLKNPNGCDVKATFFISHEWTNYDAVNWLVQKNMEIASNSISHESLENANTNRWLNEMDGQRRILAKFGGAPEEEIVGIRSPQLALGGDNQFEMMIGAEFLWDNSMSANPGIHGEPFWPQTMDYQVAWDCNEASCPKSSFPGVWSVPLNQFYGSYMSQIDSFRRSSMLRAAVDLNNTVDELEEIITRNFERSYSANRAPYVLSLNADFLQLGGHNKGMKAVQKFLNRMSAQKDVYIVTIKQLIDWMKRPVPISEMKSSKAVGCPITLSFNRNPSLSTCDIPNKCLYSTPSLSSQEHQFLTCLPCPTMYPWLENPAGGIV
ncbi:EGF-like domain-containing protein [Caenorhabditis elegans]|uniref:EGF-like domain-containing protein n=1 Tax=Caenorhabditis elegans TaxID=6239 RepID=A0A4V0IM10_CAEEL|nr:EGF-like domain-containing protein [Caenorhabditis elegans]VTW47545.1 EGF-like domain-containing protein [Caenorhabditis elegans]